MLIGHEAIRNRLEQALNSGQLEHAYLFLGPENVGKLAIATWLASGFVGSDMITNAQVISPERIEEKGKVKTLSLGVEKVREALRSLGLSSASGRRALIVDDADQLTEAAQNSFLKTLEEPPSGTLIILVSCNEGPLLQTLRSRCVTVSFSFVSPQLIQKAFPESDASVWKMGRPGIAQLLKNRDATMLGDITMVEKLSLFRSLPFPERLEIFEACSSDLERSGRVLSWWAGTLRNSITEANTPSDFIANIRLLGDISATLRDMRRFPGSARLFLEHLVCLQRSARPRLGRPFSIAHRHI